MDRKATLQRLRKLASEQLQLLNKLAQMPAPPNHLEVNAPPHGAEAQTILAALAPAVKSTLSKLTCPPGGSNVFVTFVPGKGTQQAYDAILQTITSLQQEGKLPGSSYSVVVS